jgi:hypothetical protein
VPDSSSRRPAKGNSLVTPHTTSQDRTLTHTGYTAGASRCSPGR